MKHIALAIITILAMSACATTDYRWVRKDISNEDEMMTQFGAAVNLCMKVASGHVPFPTKELNLPPLNTGYTINARIDTYTGNIYGTASPTQSFSSGLYSGMQAGSAIAAMRDRARIAQVFEDCLSTLGWSKEPKARK